ncbi:hypothetical protein L7F22_055812 [Adiantum nelumboides]|nr:hypothetical protein [Adiantum nelumboides]
MEEAQELGVDNAKKIILGDEKTVSERLWNSAGKANLVWGTRSVRIDIGFKKSRAGFAKSGRRVGLPDRGRCASGHEMQGCDSAAGNGAFDIRCSMQLSSKFGQTRTEQVCALENNWFSCLALCMSSFGCGYVTEEFIRDANFGPIDVVCDVPDNEIPSSPLLDLVPTPLPQTSKIFGAEAIADSSPSPKLKRRNDEVSPLSKKFSPKGGLKKASPLTLKNAFQIARGKTSRSLKDTSFSSSFVKEDESKNELNVEFSSQLALTPTLRVLTISELSETASFRFALERKVLRKYGIYKIPKSNFDRYMHADLLDRESRHTVTFVVTEIYLSDFVGAFVVNDFVQIEGGCVKRAVGRDGGTCLWALYVDATTLVVKAEPFDCCLQLYPEQKIKDLLFEGVVSTDVVSTIAFIVVKTENAIRSDGTPSY